MRKSSDGSDENQFMKEADPAAEPASIGALLRQARETAGLSLDAVSERTKVRPGILRDIEADNHAMLPALTYSLGFVKAFARTVGIDPQLAADRYRAESQKGEPIPTLVELEPLESRRLPSRGLVALLTTVVAVVLGLLAAWGAGWLSPAPPAPIAAAPTDSENGQTPAQTPEEAGAPDDEAPPAEDAPVRLSANTEVWLRITDGAAGETLFMGTMAKGQTLDLPPARQWQLRTGRAGAIDVTVGGQPVAALGGPAEQVRGVILTPEALLGRSSTAAGVAPAEAGAATTAGGGAATAAGGGAATAAGGGRVPGLPEARAVPQRDSSPVNPQAGTGPAVLSQPREQP